jgi:hypothetical protein
MALRLVDIIALFYGILEGRAAGPQDPEVYLAQFADLEDHTRVGLREILLLMSHLHADIPIDRVKEHTWNQIRADIFSSYSSDPQACMILGVPETWEQFGVDIVAISGKEQDVMLAEVFPNSSVALETRGVFEADDVWEYASTWLDLVQKYPEFKKRLDALSQPHPIKGDLPKVRRALAYALASDTLDTQEFRNFAAAMGYKYWDSDKDLRDIANLTRRIWSLPAGLVSPVAIEWHQHILRNAPRELVEHEDPDTLLEYITRGKMKVAVVLDQLPLRGALFTGPKTATIIEARQWQDADMNDAVASLLSHFLLEHVSQDRYGIYIPGIWSEGLDEASVRPYVLCLMEQTGPTQELNETGKKLVRAFCELGVPIRLLRALFRMRKIQCIPLVALLRGPELGDELDQVLDEGLFFLETKDGDPLACSIERGSLPS